MKTRAAVLRDVGKPFEIVELDLDEPKAGEVLVRFVASGLCHSDDHLRTGDIPVRYPIVGGHEGAGIVEQVGAGRHQAGRRRPRGRLLPAGLRALPVLLPRPDQPVRPAAASWWTTPCRTAPTATTRARTDFGQMCLLGTFSQYAVVSESSAVKIEDDIPLEVVALVGCGVPTGFGTAVNAGEVQPGRHHDRLRHRRRRHQRGAGRGRRRGALRHRGRPGGVQARPPRSPSAPPTRSPPPRRRTSWRCELTYGVGADQAIITVGVVSEEVVSAAFAAVRKRGIVVVTAMGGA